MILKKYRLELHWDSVKKSRKNICFLSGAYFSGPALKIANKINAPDWIDIDLTPQHEKVISHYYFARLFWKEVEYKEDKVFLKDVRLESKYVNEVTNFQDLDYIILDTLKHEERTHNSNLVYKGEVVTKDKVKYERK